MDQSKVLQFAYLDQIIEKCDDNAQNNPVSKLINKHKEKSVSSWLQNMDKTELDSTFKRQFVDSFYNKTSVNKLHEDNFKIRSKMASILGKQAGKGMSKIVSFSGFPRRSHTVESSYLRIMNWD